MKSASSEYRWKPLRRPESAPAGLLEKPRRFPKEATSGGREFGLLSGCDPRPDYARTLIDAIARFKDQTEPGLPRNHFSGYALSLKAIAKNRLKRMFLPGRGLEEDLNEFSELEYYAALLRP